MPIRLVSQRTDRGSIKDLVRPRETQVGLDQELPFTPSELRYRKLYEYARTYKDKKLQQAIGVITTDYIGDKTALPLSVYRIKQVVEDIKSKSGLEIQKLEKQFANHLHSGVSTDVVDYLAKRKAIKKSASVRQLPFRRVST